MKIYPLILLILASFLSCHSPSTHQAAETGKIIYEPRDREILENVLERYSADKEATMSALMIEVGLFFLETPYVAHTLERSEEQLVIDLREMDCTTFAEYCLAISRTIKSGHQTFEQSLTAILPGCTIFVTGSITTSKRNLSRISLKRLHIRPSPNRSIL